MRFQCLRCYNDKILRQKLRVTRRHVINIYEEQTIVVSEGGQFFAYYSVTSM